MVLSSNGSIIDNPAATNSHCSSSSSVITDTTVASNSGDGGGGAVTGAPVPIGENDSNNTNLVAIPVATTTTVAAKPVAVGDSPPPPNHNINNTAATESSLFLATHKKLPLEMDAHSNTDTTTATASVSPPWQTKNTESFLVSASSRTVENDVNGENGHRGVVWNSISDSPVVHHRDLELGETATAVVAAADVYTKAPTLTGAAAPPTTDADVDADDTNSHSTASLFVLFHRKLVFTLFIVLVGMGAAAALLTLGIRAAQTEQSSRFDRAAEDFSNSLEDAWGEYELFGLWLHAACRSSPDRIIQGQAPTASSSNLGICSRDEFRDVYEYIVSFGVEFKVAQLIPFVSAEARIGLESEAREFYAERYPQINYTGLVVRTLDEEGNIVVRPQSEKPFYWPVHYLEPIDGNELAIDLDVALMDKEFIDYVTTTWKPALGGGFKLVQDTDESAYSVALYHPGVPVSSEPNKEKPTEIAAILVRIPDLLTRSARLISATSLTVFLFDAHDDAKDPSFLGGVTIKNLPGESHNSNLTWLAETNLTELPAKNSTRHVERIIQVGNREWIVAVESVDGTFSPDVLFIVIGAAMIFSASLMLAFWFQAHITRLGKLDMIKREAAAEKAALIVETARKQASKERQLNEYIAHEVRNPLTSAIAALSFVSASVKDPNPDKATQAALQEDIGIVDASLQFINELLRDMLDIHRATDRQMNISFSSVRLSSDALEPVRNILKQRGNNIDIVMECVSDLVVVTDCLRLKQIILNLAIYALKSVQRGFIRLRVETLNNNVLVVVEDSGPGIAMEKRGRLFANFRESLDIMDQGAGMGISLSKHLAQLIGGDVFLDETFISGVEGCPGTRFVVDLKREPLFAPDPSSKNTTDDIKPPQPSIGETIPQPLEDVVSTSIPQVPTKTLPDVLSALFVDDDKVLRKLFVRSLRRVAEGWTVEEATSGEDALSMIETTTFDIIFVDQYMMSATLEKPLLGTETVRAMRSKGIKARICGLSANDVEGDFLENGADLFIKKPYPCEKEALKKTLIRVLYG